MTLIRNTIALLGRRAEDRVTGFKGVVSSACFDLYGCIQLGVTPAAGADGKKPIFVRADGRASYAIVAQVMAALSTSGFTSINLITDTGGPSSGASAEAARERALP